MPRPSPDPDPNLTKSINAGIFVYNNVVIYELLSITIHIFLYFFVLSSRRIIYFKSYDEKLKKKKKT